MPCLTLIYAKMFVRLAHIIKTTMHRMVSTSWLTASAASGSAACKLRALAMLVLCLTVGLQETGPTWTRLISSWKKLAFCTPWWAPRSQLCKTVWTFLWNTNCIQFCTTRTSRWRRLPDLVLLLDLYFILWYRNNTYDLLYRQRFGMMGGQYDYEYVVDSYTSWHAVNRYTKLWQL